MNALKCLVVASALAVLPAAVPANAPAASFDTHYAAFGLYNDTTHVLKYQVRWGDSGEWTYWTIAPGETMTHYYTYAYPNQNHSPVPQIRFHYNPAERQPRYKVYDLQAWAVAYAQAPAGKPYSFRYSWGGGYLDVYQG